MIRADRPSAGAAADPVAAADHFVIKVRLTG